MEGMVGSSIPSKFKMEQAPFIRFPSLIIILCCFNCAFLACSSVLCCPVCPQVSDHRVIPPFYRGVAQIYGQVALSLFPVCGILTVFLPFVSSLPLSLQSGRVSASAAIKFSITSWVFHVCPGLSHHWARVPCTDLSQITPSFFPTTADLTEYTPQSPLSNYCPAASFAFFKNMIF